MNALAREWRLLQRDRGALFWAAVALVASVFAVCMGAIESQRQLSEIEALKVADEHDRNATLARQSDWGSAGYYAFHLTYAEPAAASFLTQGKRDSYPWKHRIRILAMEGQIYEADVSSPTISAMGRFDMAFVASVLLPLLVIVLLYDLRSGEADSGRLELLEASAGGSGFWRTRVLLRAALLTLAVVVPVLAGAWWVGADSRSTIAAAALIVAHAAFWSVLALVIGAWRVATPVLLASLLGLWLLFAIVIPQLGTIAIDRSIPVPALSQIALEQREAVNDAWDLPKPVTMDAFVARYPEWKAHAAIDGTFEWKWYYAFQQVGDQTVEPLSSAYREGLIKRERYLDRFSWFSPPMLVSRQLMRLSQTDLRSMLAYDEDVRAFHKRLREFHYSKLFLDEPFSLEAAQALPPFPGKPGG